MIDIKVTRAFFDGELVRNAVSKMDRKNLSRAGAFVQQTARRSMRTRKRASASGSPPSAHEDPLLKKFLYFSYDPQRQSVVIGPIRLSGISGVTPSVEEFGGDEQFPQRVRKSGRITKARTAHYPARPYMGPAIRTEAPNIPQPWRDALRA